MAKGISVPVAIKDPALLQFLHQVAFKLNKTVPDELLPGAGLTASDIGVTVQAWSSILDNTTASFTSVDKTKLIGLIIGSTIQAWSAVLDGTEESFTTALKTKIDGMEAGATADQTAAEILTLLLSVDGATSLLDADLLDGQHGAYYLDYANLTGAPAVPATTTDLPEGTNLYYTDVRVNVAFDARFLTKSTTDLAEGTNLYYTQARFDSAFTAKSTTDLSEGTNLYYTQARFDTAFGAKSTTDLSEGTNLYYTQARADARVAAAQGIKFDISFQLDLGEDDTFTLSQYSSFGFTVDAAYYKTDAGTISANVTIDGVSITGLSALSLSAAETNSTATAANTVIVGNTLALTTSANAGAENAIITLHCTRT